MDNLIPVEPEPRSAKYGFNFHGKAVEYFKIWIVNVLLSIITLGIFSAWAKVRRKRYFYGCTELNGSTFEYHANPVRILIGRVIVVVGYLVFVGMSSALPFIGGLVTILFTLALPFIINSSLRFNAINSSYRHLRFRYKSNYWDTFIVFIVYGLFTSLTVGLFFPYQVYAIKKHIIDHSGYGTQNFEFNGKPSEFYKIYFIGFIMAVLMGAGVVLLIVTMTGAAVLGGFIAPLLSVSTAVLAMLTVTFIITFVAISQTNYIYNCLTLKDNKFESSMSVLDYMKIVVVNYFAVVLSLGLLRPWAVIRETRYRLDHLKLDAVGDFDSFIAAEDENVKALGEELGDFFDFDLGL